MCDGQKAHDAAKRPTVGQRIVEGLDEAIAWSQGEKTGARVTLGTLPALDIRELRRRWV